MVKAAAAVVVLIAACGGNKTASTETITEKVPPADVATRSPDSLPVVDSGVVLDARVDSGACPPATLDMSLIGPMHPPYRHTGMCTSTAQLEETVNRCVRGIGSCGDWLDDTANYECQECIFSVRTDTVWGPVVTYQPKRVFYNRGGAAKLSGASTACAEALYRADLCVRLACTCSSSITCESKAADAPCKALVTAKDTACAADKNIVAGLDWNTGSAFYALFCP